MKIVTVEQMRAIEQASVQLGVSLDQLQQNAAAVIASETARLLGNAGGPLLFLAGRGNNGRDGLIAGAILAEQGRAVRAYLAPGVTSEDVLSRLRAAGGEVARHEDSSGAEQLERWILDSSVIVDGLLGIGISGQVREPIAGIISTADREAQASRVPVVAVDLPSGIDADSGEVGGTGLHATWTLSLGCVKAGLLRFPAAEYVGKLVPLDIGLPAESYQGIRQEMLTQADVAALLPRRPMNSNKGTFGRVLAVTGSRNFVGAGYLVGGAAARAGCGLVTLAVPAWQRVPLASLLPEATYLPLMEMVDPKTARGNVQAIAETLADCEALAIGPGLGQGPAQTELVTAVLTLSRGLERLRTVVDADGLNALSREAEWWKKIGSGHVLTPHPGEMSRLLGVSIGEVNARRWDVAREAAAKWGQTVVLKGAFTVVASPNGDVWISGAALPALASAGTGDVLTGLIAGLMAQGLDGVAAARAGVFLHAAAAELVLAWSDTDRLLAGDLLAAIPVAIAELNRTK